jgi:carbonic anhydrase
MKHVNQVLAAILLGGACLLSGCDQNKPAEKTAPATTNNEATANTTKEKACYDTEGLLQSPVNIVPNNTQEFVPGKLIALRCAPISMQVRADVAHPEHYNIKASPAGESDPNANFILFRGERYAFNSFHFHAPSEHWDNGRRHDMELHVVFQKSAASEARIVIGAYMDVKSGNNDAIQKVWEAFGKIKTGKDSTGLQFDLSAITPDPNVCGFYSYPGSLTSPEYHEGLLWIVSENILQISTAQLNAFKAFEVDTQHIGHPRDTFAVGNRIILRSK